MSATNPLAPFDLFNLAVDASNDAYATAPDRAVSLVGLNEAGGTDLRPCSATNHACVRSCEPADQRHALHPRRLSLRLGWACAKRFPASRCPCWRCATTAPVLTAKTASASSSVSTHRCLTFA